MSGMTILHAVKKTSALAKLFDLKEQSVIVRKGTPAINPKLTGRSLTALYD